MALLANTGQGIAALINVSGSRKVCEGLHLHKGKQEDLQLRRWRRAAPEGPRGRRERARIPRLPGRRRRPDQKVSGRDPAGRPVEAEGNCKENTA